MFVPVEEIARGTTTWHKLHIISGPFAEFLPKRHSSFGHNDLLVYYFRMDTLPELLQTDYLLSLRLVRLLRSLQYCYKDVA